MQLIATKTFSYNTRRLNPGDVFEAKDPDGRLLIGVLKARKIEQTQEPTISVAKRDILNQITSEQENKEPQEEKEEERQIGELPEPNPELLNKIVSAEAEEKDGETSGDKEEDTPAQEAPKNPNVHTKGRKRK